MKPYLPNKAQGSPKFKVEHCDHVPGFAKGISKFNKLEIKNANRSRKKAARQEAKNIINNV